MNEPSARPALRDRPLLLALLSLALAGAATAGLLVWAQSDPVGVVIGEPGQHDGSDGATCLDCHVPFEGTPSSRCLAPGCHGDLATGTPPRSGPAMPVRFHAALRELACASCHTEHGAGARAPGFDHQRIPARWRARCRSCHVGEDQRAHARTDAVSCDVCHGLAAWPGARMVHERISQPCDLCHRRPETDSHASVAGTCTDCHVSNTWDPIPAAP